MSDHIRQYKLQILLVRNVIKSGIIALILPDDPLLLFIDDNIDLEQLPNLDHGSHIERIIGMPVIDIRKGQVQLMEKVCIIG